MLESDFLAFLQFAMTLLMLSAHFSVPIPLNSVLIAAEMLFSSLMIEFNSLMMEFTSLFALAIFSHPSESLYGFQFIFYIIEQSLRIVQIGNALLERFAFSRQQVGFEQIPEI